MKKKGLKDCERIMKSYQKVHILTVNAIIELRNDLKQMFPPPPKKVKRKVKDEEEKKGGPFFKNLGEKYDYVGKNIYTNGFYHDLLFKAKNETEEKRLEKFLQTNRKKLICGHAHLIDQYDNHDNDDPV